MMEFGRERVSFSHAILRTSRQRKYPPYKEGEFVVIVRLGGGESSVTEVLAALIRAVGAKNIMSSEVAFAAPRLVPSPRYFASTELVRDRQQELASCFAADYRCDARSRLAQHAIFKCAVGLGTSLRGDRRASRVELVVGGGTRTSRAGRVEEVAALAVAAKNRGGEQVVDQASVSHCRSARSSAAQRSQSQREANRRITGAIADFAGNNATLGSGRGRIVGSHTGAHQVRNSNRCDDQDDSNHDQQLDQ